jgi:hypothetical protein
LNISACPASRNTILIAEGCRGELPVGDQSIPLRDQQEILGDDEVATRSAPVERVAQPNRQTLRVAATGSPVIPQSIDENCLKPRTKSDWLPTMIEFLRSCDTANNTS